MKSALLLILSFLIMAIANIVNAQTPVKSGIAIEEAPGNLKLHEIKVVEVENLHQLEVSPEEKMPETPSPEKPSHEIKMKEEGKSPETSLKHMQKRKHTEDKSCGSAYTRKGKSSTMNFADPDDKSHCAKVNIKKPN